MRCGLGEGDELLLARRPRSRGWCCVCLRRRRESAHRCGPEVRASKSARRSPAQTAWVCGSTSAGTTARFARSMVSRASPRQACSSPAQRMRPARDGDGCLAHQLQLAHRRAAPDARTLGGDQLRDAGEQIVDLHGRLGRSRPRRFATSMRLRVTGVGMANDAHGGIVGAGRVAAAVRPHRCRRRRRPAPHAGCIPCPRRRHDESSSTRLRWRCR